MEVDLSQAVWHKSSFSNGNGGNCVEHSELSDGRHALRHSKHPERTPLIFTDAEWRAFIAGVRAGEFD